MLSLSLAPCSRHRCIPPPRPSPASGGGGTRCVRLVRMKFTLSWLKEHLETEATLAALVDRLTMIGLEVESVTDKAAALAPFTIARVISAEQHPNADRLRVCMVDTGSGAPVQVVCGAPNARTGMVSVFSPPGTFIPGKNITLGVGTIRGVESRGMLVSPFELQISDDHDGILDLPADAPLGARYAEWAHLDDPVIEINLTPNRTGCDGRARHRPRSRGCRHGDAQGRADQAGRRQRAMPGRRAARFRRDAVAVPRLRATPRARREERPEPGLAATAAHRDRAAADQCARRHHELHHLRPRPAAARVRCRQGQRRSRGAPRQAWRDAARARRQDLRARRHDVRHRRRCRCRIARRHHGRRGERLLGDDDRRADRVGAVGRARHRPHRPQARHQLRRALSLRARRRSGFHDSGPRACDPHGGRSLRRHADGDGRRRRDADRGAGDRFPSRRDQAARRHFVARERSRRRARPARLRPARPTAR